MMAMVRRMLVGGGYRTGSLLWLEREEWVELKG